MNLVYINHDNNSVMESQVLALIEYYQNLSSFKKIYLVQGFRNKKDKKQIMHRQQLYSMEVLWFRTLPNYPIFKILTYPLLQFALQKMQLDLSETVFHIRGEKFGALMTHYTRKHDIKEQLIIDIRGALPEEYMYSSIPKILRKWKQKSAVQDYRKINNGYKNTTVSEALKRHLISKYNFQESKISVNPNIVHLGFGFSKDKRKKIRQKHNIPNDSLLAVISTAGGAQWQKDYEIIEPLIEKGFLILNLSKQPIKHERIINKFIPFDKMPDYLSAADVGVLWRDENIVNKVASPSKLSEFAYSGLFIIHNGSVEIANNYISVSGNGVIVESLTDLKRLDFSNTSMKIDRNNIEVASLFFGIKTISKRYLALYNEALSQ